MLVSYNTINDLWLFLFTLNVAESSGIEKPLLKTSRKWLLATMNEWRIEIRK